MAHLFHDEPFQLRAASHANTPASTSVRHAQRAVASKVFHDGPSRQPTKALRQLQQIGTTLNEAAA